MKPETRENTGIPGRRIKLLSSSWPAWSYMVYIRHYIRRKPLGAFGVFIILFVSLVSILAPLITTHDPREINAGNVFAPPGSQGAWLGGDKLGRDVYTRLVYGARISLQVGVLSVLLGISIGCVIGITSAYFGGFVDLLVQRFVDAIQAFPTIVLALAIMAVLGGSLTNVIIALTIVFIPGASRTIRSQVLSIKEMDYVLAARGIGAGDWRIIVRHVAPNCLSTYIVLCTISLGFAIIGEASLSFLGVGISAETPSWGGMLTGAAHQFVSVAPWLGVFPGLALAFTVLAFNLLGDSLRDILDPRLRGTA